jgi:hypothetical protein
LKRTTGEVIQVWRLCYITLKIIVTVVRVDKGMY